MSLNSASSAGATHEDCKFIAGMTRPESVGAKTASPTKLPIFTACPRRFRSILSAKTFVKMPNILQVMGFFAPSSTSSGTLALNPLGPRVLNGTKRRQWTRTAVYLPTAAPLIPGVQLPGQTLSILDRMARCIIYTQESVRNALNLQFQENGNIIEVGRLSQVFIVSAKEDM